jgi:hypothetical protein
VSTPLHTTVQFRVGDIIHPYPVEVLCQLYEKNALRGEVIAVTDDGCQPAGFLVVRVPGLAEPIIVPAQKTSACPAQLANAEEEEAV